jgi:hypothetical protein
LEGERPREPRAPRGHPRRPGGKAQPVETFNSAR